MLYYPLKLKVPFLCCNFTYAIFVSDFINNRNTDELIIISKGEFLLELELISIKEMNQLLSEISLFHPVGNDFIHHLVMAIYN